MAVLERLSEADVAKYAGLWVAVQHGKVLHAADSPKAVSEWLMKKRESADVYRVPAKGEPVSYFF
jgi:hypothetical protein